MKFGSIYELQPGPKPWPRPDREYQVYHEALEQILLMEDLGWDYVWEVEHHFLAEYSSSSAPEVFLAWVAGQTSRIRIGHGVVLLPTQFNHAWRIAERAAALDIVSNGRLEFGTGRSITHEEIEGFGMDPADTRAMQLEVLDMLPRMWTQETFSWKGTYYELPERELLPKPLQQPHPPMWIAATQPESWRLAGERGLGILSFGFAQPGLLERSMEAYEDGLTRANPPAGVVNRNIAAAPLTFCAETDEEALEKAAPHAMFFIAKNLGFIGQWTETQSDDYQFYKEMALQGEIPGLPKFEPEEIAGLSSEAAMLKAMVGAGVACIGSPETCAEFVQKYEDVGIDQLILVQQMGHLTQDDLMRSIRLLGEEVLPRYQRAEPELATT